MAFTCNIDQKGRSARLRAGIVAGVLGAASAVFWAMPSGGWLEWGVSGLLIAMGLFCVFEAAMGWCVCRAMGFKTRV